MSKSLKQLSSEYSKLVLKQDEIIEAKKSLAESIKAQISAQGMTSATMPEGIFSLVPSTSYVYSKKVLKKEEELKALKDLEKEKDIAKKVIGEISVRFTPKKDK